MSVTATSFHKHLDSLVPITFPETIALEKRVADLNAAMGSLLEQYRTLADEYRELSGRVTALRSLEASLSTEVLVGKLNIIRETDESAKAILQAMKAQGLVAPQTPFEPIADYGRYKK